MEMYYICISILFRTLSKIKVANFEFGLSMLIPILLNHYMFIEFMRYLYDNKWFGSQ